MLARIPTVDRLARDTTHTAWGDARSSSGVSPSGWNVRASARSIPCGAPTHTLGPGTASPFFLILGADASFKLSHAHTSHTLSELEALYLRPFRTQSAQRARVRKERTEPTRRKWRAEAARADRDRERRRDRGECVDVVLPDVGGELDDDRFAGWSEKKLGKRKAAECDDVPPRRSPAQPKRPKQAVSAAPAKATLANDKRPRAAPSMAKADSRVRLPAALSSRGIFAARPESTHQLQHPGGQPRAPHDFSSLRKTTSELFSPPDGPSPTAHQSDSVPSLHGTTSSSTSSFFALALQQPHAPDPPAPHALASPFSARSTAASYGTTLAPASSSAALHAHAHTHTQAGGGGHEGPTVSPLLEHAASPSSALAPAPAPAPSHAPSSSSQPSLHHPPRSLSYAPAPSPSQPGASAALLSTATATATARTPLPLLGSQASFSALPPPPPLPFDEGEEVGARGAGLGVGVGSSSPDHRVRRERERAGGGGGRGEGRDKERRADGASDDEAPPADSAEDGDAAGSGREDGEEEDEDRAGDEGEDWDGGDDDGFDPLSQETVVHESQGRGQRQNSEGEWTDDDEGPRSGWAVEQHEHWRAYHGGGMRFVR